MNKLRNLIFGVLLISSSLVFGQTNKFNIGFEGGPSLIFLHGNNIVESLKYHSFSFLGGLSFQYNISKRVALRSNISFERKGMTFKFLTLDEFGIPAGVIHRSYFNYMTLPLLGRLAFGKKNNFYINAGPYLGYLLNQKAIDEAYFGQYPRLEMDNTDNYRRLDVGITSGLGTNFPLQEKLILGIEIRNNFGLAGISSRPAVNNGGLKTNSTNLLIGVTYKIGKMNK